MNEHEKRRSETLEKFLFFSRKCLVLQSEQEVSLLVMSELHSRQHAKQPVHLYEKSAEDYQSSRPTYQLTMIVISCRDAPDVLVTKQQTQNCAKFVVVCLHGAWRPNHSRSVASSIRKGCPKEISCSPRGCPNNIA